MVCHHRFVLSGLVLSCAFVYSQINSSYARIDDNHSDSGYVIQNGSLALSDPTNLRTSDVGFSVFDARSSSTLGTSDSCTAATTCENCTAMSKWYGGCHWCSHDQACHAVGSVYGCTFGGYCGISPAPHDNKNETDDDRTCYAQSTCRDCGLLSHLCHWCSHDNSCHVIGSISGCVTGVDCYSNDQCERKLPEPLPDRPTSFKELPTQVGMIPVVIIISLAAVILCCASVCCCVSSGLKSAYDELAEVSISANSGDDLASPLLQSQPVVSESDVVEEVTAANPPTESSPLVEAVQVRVNQDDVIPLSTEQGVVVAPSVTVSTTTTRRITTTTTVINNSITGRPRRRSLRSMQRLYNVCVCCYLSTVVVVISLSAFALLYFPQQPIYNICNDQVAWKSLIDSLTSMKATADFEILASISNPNFLDAALDMGKGSFMHNGAFVGTFDIPPMVAPANSIVDVLIVAHLSPDKWDALSLTAEYYRGKLILDVSVSAVIRIPELWDYTFKLNLKDLEVNVNEKSDRSLCACPTWNEPPPSPKRII